MYKFKLLTIFLLIKSIILFSICIHSELEMEKQYAWLLCRFVLLKNLANFIQVRKKRRKIMVLGGK